MQYFINVLDEEYIYVDHFGNVKILGSGDKKKDEKILQDRCLSITLVRTGNTAGITGPTILFH